MTSFAFCLDSLSSWHGPWEDSPFYANISDTLSLVSVAPGTEQGTWSETERIRLVLDSGETQTDFSLEMAMCVHNCPLSEACGAGWSKHLGFPHMLLSVVEDILRNNVYCSTVSAGFHMTD